MDRPDFTLYLGGTRSGKSARAEARALELARGPVLYVATATAHDEAMSERIRRHRARRPSSWQTLECPRNLGQRLAAELPSLAAAGGTPTILIDCVTLWVSNILFSLPDPEALHPFETEVRREMEALLAVIRASGWRWLVVSGETGLGGIQPSALGRTYADGLGLANQLLAAEARECFLVVAGRLLRLE